MTQPPGPQQWNQPGQPSWGNPPPQQPWGFQPGPGYQPGIPSQQFGYPPPPPPRRTTSGLAVAALILGILPLCAGIIGIALGIAALNQIKRTGQNGRGMAIAGIVCGTVWLIVIAVVGGVSALREDRSTTTTAGGSTSTPYTTTYSRSFSAQVKVGDCVASLDLSAPDASGESEVGEADIVDCSQSHLAEVFDKFVLTGSTMPTDAELEKYGSRCVESLKTYAPSAYDDSAVKVKYMYPKARGWAQGERWLACVASFDTARTSSIKGK